MSKAEELINSVVAGESVNDVVEKVSGTYDPRPAQNYPTAPSVGIKPEDEMDEDDSGAIDVEPPETRNYPLANTRRWPRGSHESNAEAGEPPHLLTTEGLIESVIDGEMPRDVFKRYMSERRPGGIQDKSLNEEENK